MKHTLIATAFCLLMPSLAFAYGEGETIPMVARAVHLLTNAARADTKYALKECGKMCRPDEHYASSLPPFYWSQCLENAAQMYANLVGPFECPDHDSPCTIKPSIYKDYPKTCQGQASCACADKLKCDTSRGKYTERIAGFCRSQNYNTYGENLLMTHDFYDDAVFLVNMWLHEDGYKNSGHRENLLSPKLNLAGYGIYKGTLIQDLGHKNYIETYSITSGAVFSDGRNSYFGFHFYDNLHTVKQAIIHAENRGCYEMSLQIGKSQNGLYLININDLQLQNSMACTPFNFEVQLENGVTLRYPQTGSLMYGNCGARSWASNQLPTCFKSNQKSYLVDDISSDIVPAKPFKIDDLFSEYTRMKRVVETVQKAPNVTDEVVKIISSVPSDSAVRTQTITSTTEVVKVKQCQLVTYDENDNVVGVEIVDCNSQPSR